MGLFAIYFPRCSDGRRRRSSPPVTPPPPSHPPERGKPSLLPVPSAVASAVSALSVCGTTYGRICPTPSAYTVSGSMYMTYIAGLIVPLPSRSVPMSGYLLPPCSAPKLSTPTSEQYALGYTLQPSSHCPFLQEISPGT